MDTVQINIGDKVLKERFYYRPSIYEVVSRSKRTLETKPIDNDWIADTQAHLKSFKAYDEDKVKRLKELSEQIDKLHKEYTDLYHSLPNIE
jgi:hypothetical protein